VAPVFPCSSSAGVAWGTGGLLGNLLGREAGLSPLAVAAYRLGLGGLLVLVAVGALTLFHGRRPLLGGAGHRRAALRRVGLLACSPPRSRRATSPRSH
jgi:DME family drug/metabolite transporter